MSLLQTKDSDVNTLTTNGETRNTHIITQAVSVNSTLTPGDFADRLEDIAVNGSGIPSALWRLNTEVLLNEQIDPGGDVSHPFYDALGLHFARFSDRANENSKKFGIALIDDRGDVWQVIIPSVSSRGYEYKAPKGIGNKVYFPSLTEESIAAICLRYGLDRSTIGNDYWEDFRRSAVPLHVTEGAKKALGGLSVGLLCCAVYGQNCLHSPDLAGWNDIRVAVDQDTGYTKKGQSKAQNNRKARIGAFFHWRDSAAVSSIEWNPDHGKGMDDLLVNHPEHFWEAFNNPKPVLRSWDTLSGAEKFSARYVPPSVFREGNTALKSPKGTGKSEAMKWFLAPYMENGHRILSITHRLSLGGASGERWGLGKIEDGHQQRGWICFHSMKSNCQSNFNPDQWKGAIVVIDEVLQLLRDACNSSIISDSDRAIILGNLKTVCCNALRLIIMDADLSDSALKLFRDWGLEFNVLENTFKPKLAKYESWDNGFALLDHSLEIAKNGGKLLVQTDTQKNLIKKGGKASGKFSTVALENRYKANGLRVLRIDAETLEDPNHPAFQCLRYEDGRVYLVKLIPFYDAIIASPSINTGVDLAGLEGVFAANIIFINGGCLNPRDVSQKGGRLRDPDCVRKIFIRKGFNSQLKRGNGATFPKALIEGCNRSVRASLEVLVHSIEETTIDASWLNFWAREASLDNACINNYRESVLDFLKSEGHEVVEADPLSGDGDIQAEIAIEIAESRAEEVREAIDITPSMASELEKRDTLTRGERAALTKHKHVNRYGFIDEDSQRLDATTGYSALRLGWMVGRSDAVTLASKHDQEYGESIGNGAWLPTVAKRNLLSKVRAIVALGVPDLFDREFCGNDLLPLLEKAKQCSRQVRDLLGVTVGAKSKPVPLIRSIAQKLGRNIEKTKTVNGIRYYRFSQVDTTTARIFAHWDQGAVDQQGAVEAKYLSISEATAPDLPKTDKGQGALEAKYLSIPEASAPGSIPIISGPWAGMRGTPEGASFQGLTGEWRLWLSIDGFGVKSIPMSDIQGVTYAMAS